MKKMIVLVLLVLTVLTMVTAVAAVPRCNEGLISAHTLLHGLDLPQQWQDLDPLHIAADHIECGGL